MLTAGVCLLWVVTSSDLLLVLMVQSAAAINAEKRAAVKYMKQVGQSAAIALHVS